jgi:N-acetylglucosamine-6-phosphate deacetylase
MRFAITGARVFDGAHMLDGHTVLVEEGRIAGVVPAEAADRRTERQEVEGLLAPGFIDIQVNGGGGVLFNDQPTVEGIRAIGAAHRRYGTTGFLPTLITDRREQMAAAVEASRQALADGVPGVLGVHLEGPFLNPARKGVHDPAFMRPIEDGDFRIMTSLGAGRTLITMAPEMVGPDAVARLAEAGVIVSAGHSAADYETLQEARGRGLRGYTHLFNAMPPLQSREPGPVGAALDDPEAWCSLIVDMHHVGAPAMRIALAAKGTDRVVLITDAMSTVGSDAASFQLLGRTIFRENGRLTARMARSPGRTSTWQARCETRFASLGLSYPRRCGWPRSRLRSFCGWTASLGVLSQNTGEPRAAR